MKNAIEYVVSGFVPIKREKYTNSLSLLLFVWLCVCVCVCVHVRALSSPLLLDYYSHEAFYSCCHQQFILYAFLKEFLNSLLSYGFGLRSLQKKKHRILCHHFYAISLQNGINGIADDFLCECVCTKSTSIFSPLLIH